MFKEGDIVKFKGSNGDQFGTVISIQYYKNGDNVTNVETTDPETGEVVNLYLDRNDLQLAKEEEYIKKNGIRVNEYNCS